MIYDVNQLIIEPLAKKHDKKQFSCGNSKLDQYLQRQANQDIKRKITRVFVATEAIQPANNATNKIIGFYTLSALSIEAKHLPDKFARKLPKHPLTAVLIGRLAIDQKQQGSGIGRMLLIDAIKRTLQASETIAVFAIIVDAKDAYAKSFYEAFGFQSFNGEKRLFLPLSGLIL